MQNPSNSLDAVGTGPGAQASTQPLAAGLRPPEAIFVVVVQRDRVQISAQLDFGGSHTTVSRVWHRRGGSWRTTNPEFVEREHHIGLALAEFADAIDFPGKVADMLPREPVGTPEAGHD